MPTPPQPSTLQADLMHQLHTGATLRVAVNNGGITSHAVIGTPQTGWTAVRLATLRSLTTKLDYLELIGTLERPHGGKVNVYALNADGARWCDTHPKEQPSMDARVYDDLFGTTAEVSA